MRVGDTYTTRDNISQSLRPHLAGKLRHDLTADGATAAFHFAPRCPHSGGGIKF